MLDIASLMRRVWRMPDDPWLGCCLLLPNPAFHKYELLHLNKSTQKVQPKRSTDFCGDTFLPGSYALVIALELSVDLYLAIQQHVPTQKTR